MKLQTLSMTIAYGVGLLFTSIAWADYVEHWDGADSHNWQYWTGGQPDNGGHGTAMTHHPTGGQSGGYVSAPLADLSWAHNPAHLWPAYTVRAEREPAQNLDLNQDPIIEVYVNQLPGANLEGGAVALFIGQFTTQQDHVFFYHDTFATINSNSWDTKTTIDVRTGNWIEIVRGAANTQQPEDLYADPEQYGITLLGQTASPSGLLGFDEFANIPEPATIMLIGLGTLPLRPSRKRP